MQTDVPINQGRLWHHLERLCRDIGPRLSGTAADERTVRYLADHFRRCGARVEVQDFPCPSWEHDSTTLSLLGAGDPQPLPAVAQTFSLPCDVEAPLAAVGTWQELDLAPDLEQRALLLYGAAASGLALDRNPTLLSIEERRAAAVIVVSPAETLETVATKLIRDPFLAVPAVAVPYSTGVRLRQHPGGRIRLRTDARRYRSTGHNVIGHLPGRAPGRVAVAAHYDTAAGVPGATDNASGTAAVLELCEVFAAAGTPALGIDFVAFGADEYGRHRGGNLGAAEYVRRHPQAVGETRAVVEADGVGTAPRRPRVRLIGWPAGGRERLKRVLSRFPAYEVNDQSDDPTARPTAFNLPGVPALAFVDDYRFLPIHTVQDTIDLMSSDGLAFAAEVMAASIAHLVSEPPPTAGEGAGTP
ncbi:MAG: M28 family peptidase [Chloroflexota bacterium]|nr:M28 family peptidase [Chloroflexota bacterium]